MKYVVGLGNPGRKYARTRHNVGWVVLQGIAAEFGAGRERKRRDGRVARAGDVTLLKPTTYMNDSGRAVASLLHEMDAAPRDVLVVTDDLNLELGVLRLRRAGSAGGHRGLESVINWLGTDEFPRLKIGVGPRPENVDARDFVLGRFSSEQQGLLALVIGRAVPAALCWLREGVDTAMNQYNGPVE